jgi:hypothetical protein
VVEDGAAGDIIRTSASYWSGEAKYGGGPALGQRRHRMLRQLAKPVSAP